MTIRLAGIGLGGLGQRELSLYAAREDVEIAAGVDVSPEMRAEFEENFNAPTYSDYQELLEAHGDEIDAVTIVTPHTLHYEQATACLEAGLHVFLEKPLVTDIDHAHELVDLAAERDLVLVVGYQRHFHPAYRRIKEIIDGGKIGDIHMISCYLGQDWIGKFTDAWRSNPGLSGGGQLYDSGSHLLDSMLWTTGTTPKSVAATMDNQGHDVDVNSALAVELDRDGRTVTGSIAVTGDGAEGPGTYEGLVVWGTKGRLSFTDGSLLLATRNRDSDTADVREVELDGDISFESLFKRKLDDFIEAVKGNQEPTVPGTFGLQVVALTEAAYDASESGSTVDVTEYL